MRLTESVLVTLFTTTSGAAFFPRYYDYVALPCAVNGDDTSTSYLWTGPNDTYPACSLECLSRPTCTGLSISNSSCNLYDVPMGDVYNWNADGNNTYWDIQCETKYVQCAAAGYQDDWEDFWYSANMTLESCAAECRQVEEFCLSYSFGNGECALYEIPVSGIVDPADDSPYMFYDIRCDVASDNSTDTVAGASTTITTSTATKHLTVTSALSSTTDDDADDSAATTAAPSSILAFRDSLKARKAKTTSTTTTTTTTTTITKRKKKTTTTTTNTTTTTTKTKSEKPKTTTTTTTTQTTTTKKPKTTSTMTSTTKTTQTPKTTTTSPPAMFYATTMTKASTSMAKSTTRRQTMNWGEDYKVVAAMSSSRKGVD